MHDLCILLASCPHGFGLSEGVDVALILLFVVTKMFKQNIGFYRFFGIMLMMVTHDEHITHDPKNVIILVAVLRIPLFGCAHLSLQRWPTTGSTTYIVFRKCYNKQYLLIDVVSHVDVSEHLSIHDLCDYFASCPPWFRGFEEPVRR